MVTKEILRIIKIPLDKPRVSGFNVIRYDSVGYKRETQRPQSDGRFANTGSRRAPPAQGGPSRKIRNVALTTFEAVRRIVDEADRARAMMRDKELEPDDIKLALIYCTPEKPGFEDSVGYKWLPAPQDIGKFFTAFDEIAAIPPYSSSGFSGIRKTAKPRPRVRAGKFLGLLSSWPGRRRNADCLVPANSSCVVGA